MSALLEHFLLRPTRKPPEDLMKRVRQRFPEIELIYREDVKKWQLIEFSRRLGTWLHVRYLTRKVLLYKGTPKQKLIDYPEEPNFNNVFKFLAQHDMSSVLASQSLENFNQQMIDDDAADEERKDEAAFDGPLREANERVAQAMVPRIAVTKPRG